MIRSFKFLVFALMFCGLGACDESSTKSPLSAEDSDNWLLGQWAIDNEEGFDLTKACERPATQFGNHYVYWRGDVDGEPHEELDKVNGYIREGNLIKASVLPPNSYWALIQEDGYMHIERLSADSVKIIRRKFPNHSPVLFKCPSSPIPYSADVAPTPPKYEGIEPGIVDRPRS